jgi:acetyl-CoA C-acetyltransferase
VKRPQPTMIVAARRTPIGALGGSLAALRGHELGALAITAAMRDAHLGTEEIDETILGQVLTGGQGMNPARQAARLASIADKAPSMTINQVCGSGLRAVALAHQQIAGGDARVVVAGGQESMSNAAHAAIMRHGMRLGDVTLRDTMLSDGLTDAFYGYPMGRTAENVARHFAITREQQDLFALASQQKASSASLSRRFAPEIVPIDLVVRGHTSVVDADEYVRHDATLAAMERLKPAFADDGTVTAGNSSGINDGAAALVLMARDEAERRGLRALGKIAGWAQQGIDPQMMGLGPIQATQRLLSGLGWSVNDVDLWEVNEAFAAQSLAVLAELKLDGSRVNVNGGAIALGHPIGASGARVLVTLLHEMARRDARRGVATLCIGGGMGIALAVQRD